MTTQDGLSRHSRKTTPIGYIESLGKVFSPTEFRRAGARIQDIVSSHPWCSGAKPSMPTNAVFATLVKQPTESGDEPYCFTPHFFVGDRNVP